MTIGERITASRRKCGYTQTELADKLGISKQTLYKYENGLISNIPSNIIENIANKCNVSPAFLMGWVETNDSEFNLYEIDMRDSSFHRRIVPYYLSIKKLIENTENLKELFELNRELDKLRDDITKKIESLIVNDIKK